MANLKVMLEDNKVTPIKLKVVGVGGGGGKIVGRLGPNFEGIDFIGIDTDAQALHLLSVPFKVQIGEKITGGIGGAGCDPEKGKFAANEDRGKISELLKNTHILFLVCGLGGGTGTGAAPVIGKIAKDLGSLVIGISTMPFKWEKKDMNAQLGYENLKNVVDTLICIPNEKLQEIVDRDTPFIEAFKKVDEVVGRCISAVYDLINKPSHIMDLDFTDIKRVLENGGKGLVGIGKATGEKKAVKALKSALSDPLLGEHELPEAKNILVSIIGSHDLSLPDVAEAMQTIQDISSLNKVAFGLSIDEGLNDEANVTLMATGIEESKQPKKKIMSEQKNKPSEPNIFTTEEEIKEEEYKIPPSLRKKSINPNLEDKQT
jgi:cell division protein FtsZ